MEIAFEVPANPHFLLVHVRRHLTDEMAEKYTRTTMTSAPAWLRPFFDFQTISHVHLMRHRVRFRTYRKQIDWSPFREFLLAGPLPAAFGAVSVTTAEASQLRRSYPAPEEFPERLVVEGLKASQVHPLTAAIYQIEGVVELIGRRRELVVKRSPIYNFEEIEARLKPLLTGPK